MKTETRAEIKASRLAERAIVETCAELLKDGGKDRGIADVLTYLAILMHGEVLPAPVVLRLRRQTKLMIEAMSA